MIELTKSVDQEPILIAAGQVARVHGRRGPQGRLFAEVHVVGGKKPVGVTQRLDQVAAALEGAGVQIVRLQSGEVKREQ